MHWKRALGALVAALLILAPEAAFGAQLAATRVEISVGKQLVTVAPGQEYVSAAQVVNYDATVAHLTLYGALVVDTAQASMGFAPAGQWVRLGVHHLNLPANTATKLSFGVTVPQGTKPGVYVLAIVAQYTPGASHTKVGKIGVLVHYNIRSVALLAVKIPGTKVNSRLVAEGLKQGVANRLTYTVTSHIGNPGNAYEYVQSRLVVHNGPRKTTFPGPLVLLLAHSHTAVTFLVPAADVGQHTVAYAVFNSKPLHASVSGSLRVIKIKTAAVRSKTHKAMER